MAYLLQSGLSSNLNQNKDDWEEFDFRTKNKAIFL